VEEATLADRVAVFSQGRLIGAGSPREVLSDLDLLHNAGLTPPLPVKAYYDLQKEGVTLPCCPLTHHELVEVLCPSK